jgi:hypothetical protein
MPWDPKYVTATTSALLFSYVASTPQTVAVPLYCVVSFTDEGTREVRVRTLSQKTGGI